MKKVPVILISGFWGSGKTTLLLRLLARTNQHRLQTAVLMNEISALDVDSRIVSAEMPDIPVEHLLDGCICCSKRSEIGTALRTLLFRNPDLIVMETAGVANPEQIMAELRSPALADRLALTHHIAVVDAGLFLEYNSMFASDKELVRTLRRQISSAHIIVVNKTDTCGEQELGAVLKAIHKINAHAVVQPVEYSRANLDSLFENDDVTDAQSTVRPRTFSIARPASFRKSNGIPIVRKLADSKPKPSPLSALDTLTLHQSSPQALERQQLETFLSAIGPTLLRAKGYCILSGEGTVLIQFSGRRFQWQPSQLPVANGYLTLIGDQLDKKSITVQWEKCIH